MGKILPVTVCQNFLFKEKSVKSVNLLEGLQHLGCRSRKDFKKIA